MIDVDDDAPHMYCGSCYASPGSPDDALQHSIRCCIPEGQYRSHGDFVTSLTADAVAHMGYDHERDLHNAYVDAFEGLANLALARRTDVEDRRSMPPRASQRAVSSSSAESTAPTP